MSSVGKRDKTFTILSTIAILLILLGHLNWGILEFGGYFPYYSYHVLIFVFISGYFYKPEDEEHIGTYILHKFKKLIVPYLMINLICGIVMFFLHKSGFTFGGDISIRNLLWAPFEGGHQFMINAPGWFIPALFMLEMCNIVCRKIFTRILGACKKLLSKDSAGEEARHEGAYEYCLMLVYLLAGVSLVYLAIRGSIYDWRKIPGRLIFMAPVFQFGRLYRAKLEAYDAKIPTIPYLIVIIAVNVLLCKTQAGLAFSAVWVTGFANSPIVPYITILTGVALWLRISKLLAKMWEKSQLKLGLLDYIGANTYSICLFHLSGFLLVNAVLSYIVPAGFDMQLYHDDIYYAFSGNFAGFKLIYVIVGIGISLALSRTAQFIHSKLSCWGRW